jgi:type IV secretion system protein VirB10
MKSSRLFPFVFALAVIIPFQNAYSQSAEEKISSTPTEPTLTVPADTTIPLTLMNTINSRTTRPGQPVYCETIYPITVGNRIVIPKGSSVKGSVTQVVRPGHVKGKGQIGIRFETLILPNGATHSLRATLSGFGSTGREEFQPKESKIQGASSTGEKAGKVAQTTITGAEAGTIVGLATGSPGKGIGIGSLAGAVGGLVWAFSTRGKEVVLPSGTNFELQLTVPLAISRDELDSSSRYDAGPALPRNE